MLFAEILEKWVSLGRPAWDTEDSFSREVAGKEHTINTILGRQLLPAHPIVVLALLQTMESVRNPGTVNGSYGELYEALMTGKLASVSKRPSDVGIMYAIISRLAYRLYDNAITSVSNDEIEAVCDEFFAGYDIRRAAQSVIDELLKAGILKEVGGSFTFFYQYYYHFFVARYFRDTIGDPIRMSILKERLVHMADRVYYEILQNIIVFYLYLTKDTGVIDHILNNASAIYVEREPCSLDGDVYGLNVLANAPEPIQLQSEDTEKNRETLRENLDNLEEQAIAPNESGEKLVYDDALSDIIKLNIAFKTIHILGHVLRSFPGDVKKELKTRVAEQCYRFGTSHIGLRARSFWQ